MTIEYSISYLAFGVPRTGLEPARLSALAPETSASTIPPPGLVSLPSAADSLVGGRFWRLRGQSYEFFFVYKCFWSFFYYFCKELCVSRL